jgi:four helix bundle protein
MKKNIIQEKSFHFSLQIIELYKMLLEIREFVISRQMLKSATSIGANVREALRGESKKDFIHKMSISLKEAHETDYWLQLLQKSKLIEQNIDPLVNELNEIISILTKIIKTSKANSEF